MSRYIRSLKGTLACMALGAMLAGCSADDIDTPRDTTPTVADDTQLVINLAVPTEMATAPGSRADVPDSGDPSMTPTAAEATVRDLTLVLVKSDGGAPIVRRLMAPDEMPISPERTAMYEITDLDEGSYTVYLFANLADVINESTTTSTDKLNDARIKYGDDGRALTAGNLPMVYEGTAAITVKGKNDAMAAPMVNASLRFACAKVRMNLVFDKNDPEALKMFGTSGIMLKALKLQNLSKESKALYTPIFNGGPVTTPMQISEGTYYTAFTDTPANASANDKWVLNVSGTGSKALSGSAYASTWVWQADFYVPERYVSNKLVEPTKFYIEAASTTATGAQSNITMNYTINLGETDGDNTNLNVERGKLYEVIGRFRSYNNGKITTNVIAREWEPNQIDVDMVATYLKLAKTTASVTSLDDDQVTYDTDSKCVPELDEVVAPDNWPGDVPPVELTVADNTLKFSVHSAVDITKFTEEQQKNDLKGVAKCYIKAGNIRKLVEVAYDITPFFIIEPVAVKIQYDQLPATTSLRTKTFYYRTNLGGLLLSALDNPNSPYLSPNGGTGKMTTANSNIQFAPGSGTASLSTLKGTVTVTALNDPGTTTEHYLSAYPAAVMTDKRYTSYKINLTVTVLPDLGGYRIYFRSINDYQDYTGGNTTKEFLGGDYKNFPAESPIGSTYSQGSNWIDSWTPNNLYNNNIDTDHHRVYIYSQLGETTDINGHPAWRFTGSYGDGKDYWEGGATNDASTTNQLNQSQMRGDSNNPGWYYFDLNKDAQAEKVNNPNWSQPTVEPGRTLIIFYNNSYCKQGFAPHRAAHHLDPGITLFDYEDREGYYVYDPTMEPYYRIYDERPIIEDIEYTVYSKTRVTGWYNKYGVAESEPNINSPLQWKIYYSNTVAQQSYNNGWYKTVIKLKAIKGDYEKAIKLQGLDPNSSAEDNKNYVYYANCNNSGWSSPKAYFFDGGVNNGWPGTAMTYCSDLSTGAMKVWRVEVPGNYLSSSANVIFNNGSSGNGNQTANLGMHLNYIYYSDSGSWMEYTPIADTSVMLFGGQAYPQYNHTATYENGKWRGGKP